ncbi:hypothetical protein BH10CYA1_BH10CYA1_17860 [soil metagenome]
MSTIDHLFQLLREKNQCASYQLFRPERGTVTQLADGSRVMTDLNDCMVQVEYGSGVTVVRHADYVLVQAKDNAFWFGNSQGQWYLFD